MRSDKIDPGLSMLLLMTQEELERVASEGRMGLKLEGGEATATVTIRVTAGLPIVEGVEVQAHHESIVTARVRLSSLDALSERPEVVYISPVRGGRFLLHRTRAAVGASVTDGQRIRSGAEPWDGTGVTVGIVDSGVDLRHPAFRQYPGGPTRVLFFWDRASAPRPGDTPGPTGVGVLYTRAQIDTFLLGAAANPPVVNPAAMDFNGHGSHVGGITAGRSVVYKGAFADPVTVTGIAPGADLIVVRIAAGEIGQLHNICNWVFSQAPGPCVINLSLGNTSSSHDGTSDLETGLDDLLRDPGTLAPHPGRFIAVAAGNERVRGWHARARVLGAGRPVTQLVWVSPAGNDAVDEMAFWYPGIDQVRVRLVSPIAPPAANRITHWVAPDPAGCIEQPSPGGFAPTAAGGAPSKRFNFADGTIAFISQAENPLNGDRQIAIRIQPPAAAGGVITAGLWLIEFEGVNDMPGRGRIEGWLRDDVPDAPPNTTFFTPSLTTRSLTVRPGHELHQDIFLPLGVARAVTAVFEYPEHQSLEVQVRPPLTNGTPASQWVGHGPVAVAGGGLTAPGAPVPAGLPFVFGGQTVNVNHVTVAGHKHITVEITGAPPVDTGLYRVSLRVASGDRPVDVEARLLQDHTARDEFCVFRDDPFEETTVEVFPNTCTEAVSRLFVGDDAPMQVDLEVTIPGGQADVRVRVPPEDHDQETGGWTFTPWVEPGNTEVIAPGSLPLAGGAPGARAYNTGTMRVTVNYPGPAGPARITLEDTGGGNLREGEWRLELRGRAGVVAPFNVTSRLVHFTDVVEHGGFVTQGTPELDRQQAHLNEGGEGLVVVPFVLSRETADNIRVELVYDSRNEVRVRVRPPGRERPGSRVGPGNAVTNDVGAVAPAVGAGGVTSTVDGGTRVTIDHLAADVFPGRRRALVTIQRPAGDAAFHPRGLWRLEIEPVTSGGAPLVTVRTSADGHAASLLAVDAPRHDDEEGSLSTPGTAREVISVANGVPDLGPVTAPNVSSSPGPVRPARWTRLAGANRQWLGYAKPEITAPGTGIAAACSSFTALWSNAEVPLGWNAFGLPDGRQLSMRATWPLLANGQRTHVQNVPPAAAVGTVTETTWPIVIPQGAAGDARLVVRYPAARDFSIRVTQPAGAPGDRRTNAVRPNGAEIAVGGAGVAPSVAAGDHPDGVGRVYTMGDRSRVFIRQDGHGKAVVIFRRQAGLAQGQWQVTVRHTEVFPAAVPVTLEAEPQADARGWPKFVAALPPRVSADVGPAPAAATPFILNIPFTVPPRMAGDVTVRITYPAPPVGPGAYVFHVLVLNPGGGQFTRTVDSGGGVNALPGALAVNAAVANGARFQFATGDRVTIVHVPGSATVTFNRGVSANQRIADGQWTIRVANVTVGAPAAPVTLTAEIDPGPHDAAFFRLPDGPIPYAFMRAGNFAVGVLQEWALRMPEGRRKELSLELIYDARDSVRVQLEGPNGAAERTEPVALGDAAAAGALGATLANTAAAGATPSFTSAGRFRCTISNQPHPGTAGNRRHALISIVPDGDGPLPGGDWRVRIDPTAIGAGSNGVVEAWIEEMLCQTLTGTSMASPHVAGLAALMLQQDHTATHLGLKARLLSTAKPLAITRGGDLQLPNAWDPAAGWGVVDGARALLRHRNTGVEALGKTTGCPVACQDNCVIAAVRDAGGAVVALAQARQAPYNLSPERQGSDPLPGCPRLERYLALYRGAEFAGGEAASFEAGASVVLRRPLVRARDRRGSLGGFRPVAWEEAYRTVAERLVEQWASTGAIVIIAGRADAGLVRELLFNRFVHHFHHLLTATNHVTKCSFTTKKKVSVVSPSVPFGSVGTGAAYKGIKELLDGRPAALHSRGDLSLAQNVVVWGANLPASASELWRQVQAARERRGDALKLFVIDPGMSGLPDFARRIAIAPGSDRHLALALMLRMAGNPAHATANRQIPPDPRFADSARGVKQFVGALGNHVDEFIEHVRGTAADYFQVAGGVVSPDAALFDKCLPGASPADRARFVSDFNALYEAYMGGPTATILGSAPSRYVDGEEHVQYVGAVCLLSGNAGVPGGGISFGEDRNASFNGASFASRHDTLRPVENTDEMGAEEVQEALDIASLGSDAPDNTKVVLWFDMDPLTHLPDSSATQALLERTQLNVQIAPALDDSSRFADIVLPLGDSLVSWDLQTGRRSPWLVLTQPVQSPDETGPRPMARVLHELFKALRDKLADEYEDDLKPTINETLYRTGPLLLPRARRQELAAFFTDANHIPDLLRDGLPAGEVANVHARLRDWYTSVHGGEPVTDTDQEVSANDWAKLFNGVQVDWIVETLLARYSERESVILLYNLLQRGVVLDPAVFNSTGYGVLPDGGTPFGTLVVRGSRLADLKGAGGFAPERTAYRNAVQAVDGGATGRARFPMRLIIAQDRAYDSAHIPLDAQVNGGAVRTPLVWLNPRSPSIAARALADGGHVALVGNVTYAPGQVFEAVIARAEVRVDDTMAMETVLMRPGWHGLDRGGQKLVRGVHSEEGETPAMSDNLVRVEVENYRPAGNAANRGPRPPKR